MAERNGKITGPTRPPAKIGFVSGLGDPQLVQTGQSLIHVHSMSRSSIMRLGVTEIGACGLCLREVLSENRGCGSGHIRWSRRTIGPLVCQDEQNRHPLLRVNRQHDR